jgi:hypothetical protein
MKIANSTLKRAAVPVLVAGLVVPVFATPAAAQTPGSTAFRIFGNVILSARGNAVNTVTADTSSGRVILTDTSGIAPGNCRPLSPTSVDCGSTVGVARISVGLGDLGDTFNGTNVGLRTVVDAGPGMDIVSTGSGNDTIGLDDNAPGDSVTTCGGGSDTVFYNPGDTVDTVTCEARFLS